MKKGLVTTRLCGLVVFLLTLAARAGAVTPTPEPAKPTVEKPVPFDESAVTDFYRGSPFKSSLVTARGVGLTFIREPSRAI